jgi:hypothetical protein
VVFFGAGTTPTIQEGVVVNKLRLRGALLVAVACVSIVAVSATGSSANNSGLGNLIVSRTV